MTKLVAENENLQRKVVRYKVKMYRSKAKLEELKLNISQPSPLTKLNGQLKKNPKISPQIKRKLLLFW